MYPAAFIESHGDWLEQRLQAQLAVDYPATSDYARQLQLEAAHDTYDRLPQITCPTLIQTGTDDLVVPAENSRKMARLIPNAQLIEYADGGHLIIAQYETKVAEDILAFIDGNSY